MCFLSKILGNLFIQGEAVISNAFQIEITPTFINIFMYLPVPELVSLCKSLNHRFYHHKFLFSPRCQGVHIEEGCLQQSLVTDRRLSTCISLVGARPIQLQFKLTVFSKVCQNSAEFGPLFVDQKSG